MAPTHIRLTLTLLIALSILMAARPTMADVELPLTAYGITENLIPKLLGMQLPNWMPKLLGIQVTGIYQDMPPFHSPYQGANSLRFDDHDHLGRKLTHTYGIYFGSQLTRLLQVYLDIEMFRGAGISDGVGLGAM